MKIRSIHSLLILTVAACLYIQIGCDGDNPAGVPRNSQPVIEEIPDKAVDAGTETTVQVQVIDSDVDDTHTISASSGDTTIATVSVSNTTLIIRGIAGGEVTITISVTDDSGQDNAQSESITFQVTVPEPPPLESEKFSEFNGASEYTPVDWLSITSSGGFHIQIGQQTMIFGGCSNFGIFNNRYDVKSSKWQYRKGDDSEWVDVPGSERTGETCAFDPSYIDKKGGGHYRFVAEISIDGEVGKYASSNILEVRGDPKEEEEES